MNILFTCAGRRNYLLQYFKEELRGSGLVIAADMQTTAAAMAAADKAIVVPPLDDDGYVDALIDVCRTEHIDALFSLHDVDLALLARRKADFEALGVRVVVSDPSVIDTCFDKLKTGAFAHSIGLDAPRTYTRVADAVEAIDRGVLTFPLVVKPRWGSASNGLEFPVNREELELAFRLLTLKLVRMNPHPSYNADANGLVLIQEHIAGTEYGLDVLNDLDGRVSAVYVKEKLAMRAGETDKAVLRDHPKLHAAGLAIGGVLGHVGNLDCDVIESEGRRYLIDMNPRFGGGYPFTHQSGGNYVAALLAWLSGKTFDTGILTRTNGQVYAKCDTLVSVGQSPSLATSN